MDTFKPYRVVQLSPTGEFLGCISPSLLQLATREEAETIAQRYSARYPSKRFGAIEVDPPGYQVTRTDA